MAGLAAHAAWHMGHWEEMALYTTEMRVTDSSTGAFLTAVQAVHNQEFGVAKGAVFKVSVHLEKSAGPGTALCVHWGCIKLVMLRFPSIEGKECVF